MDRSPLAARAAIVAAGPLANFLLAILLFWALFMAGVPIQKPVVGEPTPGSAAQAAGVHCAVSITRLNDVAIASWQDLHWQALKEVLRGEPLRIETVDGRGILTRYVLALPRHSEALEQAPLETLGLVHYLPPLPPVLGDINPEGVAAHAGLRRGDRILRIDGVAMTTWEQVVESIRRAPGQRLRMSLEHGKQTRELTLTPASVVDGTTRIGRIGAGPWFDPALLATLQGNVRYAPLPALRHALTRTWELTAFSLEMLARMGSGQSSLKNLSGPLTIADYAGQSAASGVGSFVAFLALLSVSLGVLNLLPVPLLDGGHLLYYLAEFLTGRPVPDRIQEIGQKIGMGLLGLLMFFAFYNDLSRLF